MGGILLLLALCAVMACASFLAGALPLSMTLTQSQLRLISSIGVGILVGTSLIVIIPEGIEAVAATVLNPLPTAGGGKANVATRHFSSMANLLAAPPAIAVRSLPNGEPTRHLIDRADDVVPDAPAGLADPVAPGAGEAVPQDGAKDGASAEHGHDHENEPRSLPTFFIGFALVTGFVSMFLIDRLPRHAVDKLQTAPTTRHISLDNLASSMSGRGGSGDSDLDGDGDGAEMEGGFLGSLTPTPRQSRGLATTVGLVIHAAADGIAMGASATTEDMKLGLVIFVAIMVHKAPAAFGLTSVLLKHGLSKRAARGHLVVFSLAAPFGALTTYVIFSLIGGASMEGESGQWWTGMLLLFSAGTFLYVAMQAMQEESGGGGHDHYPMLGNGYGDGLTSQRRQNRPQMRDTLATIGGMLLPLLTQFGHHH